MGKQWTPDSWKNFKLHQQPKWENLKSYNKVIQELSTYPPLVFAGEVRALKKYLAEAAIGKGFLLQGGDCAETFSKFNHEYSALQLMRAPNSISIWHPFIGTQDSISLV